MIYFLDTIVNFFLTLLNLGGIHFEVFGVLPMLSLFYIIALTHFRSGFSPYAQASLSGILLDIFSSGFFGKYLIFFLILVSLEKIMYKEKLSELNINNYYPLVGLGLALIYWSDVAFLKFQGVEVSFLEVLGSFLVFVMVNALWSMMMYFIFKFYFDKISLLEKDKS